MKNKKKITKEEFDNLYSDTISKKDYDYIDAKIDMRFAEIISGIRTNNGWFDYSNEGGKYGPGGTFDKEDYKENIRFTGEAKVPFPYSDDIPTRWLWEDFEEEFRREVEKDKEREQDKKEKTKIQRQARKQKLLELQESIKNKLTKDELRAVSFKK